MSTPFQREQISEIVRVAKRSLLFSTQYMELSFVDFAYVIW